MADRFLRLPEVESRVGMKKTAIYDRINEGQFPAQIKLGRNVAVWQESAIDKWIADQIAPYEQSGKAA
jgi:prophage regulatory protein